MPTLVVVVCVDKLPGGRVREFNAALKSKEEVLNGDVIGIVLGTPSLKTRI